MPATHGAAFGALPLPQGDRAAAVSARLTAFTMIPSRSVLRSFFPTWTSRVHRKWWMLSITLFPLPSFLRSDAEYNLDFSEIHLSQCVCLSPCFHGDRHRVDSIVQDQYVACRHSGRGGFPVSEKRHRDSFRLE